MGKELQMGAMMKEVGRARETWSDTVLEGQRRCNNARERAY